MKIFFWFLSLLISSSIYGQKRIQVGFDVGIKFDAFSKFDDGGSLRTAMPLNGLYGLNLGYEFKKSIVLELGLYRNHFLNSFYFEGQNGSYPLRYSSFSNFRSNQISLDVRKRINLYRGKVNVLGVLGALWLTNDFRGIQLVGSGKGGSSDGNSKDSASYKMTCYKLRGNNIISQIGTGFEFLIKGRIYFDVLGKFYYGSKPITQIELNYSINNSKINNAIVEYRGTSFNVLLGFRCPIIFAGHGKK